ncbi:MAG TPA: ABC transporter permease [Candidatus Saccharimonadales bacterium]|nr:ABC transporter permease [Candidatus Saccharimonadales bacterium]
MTNFKLAVGNLRATRVRTTLTILGVIIGVTSVTAVLALTEGAKNAVSGQVTAMGDNLLTIRPGKAKRDGGGALTDYNYLAAFGASTLTERDMANLGQIPGVASLAPLMLVTGSVADVNKHETSGVIVGTTSAGDDTLGLSMRAGEFVNEQSTSHTVVLGRNLALDLFGSDVAIGHKVLLRGKEFTVTGITNFFPSSTTVSTVFDLNNAAFVSLGAAKSFNQGVAQIQQINVRVSPNASPKEMAATLHQKLVANHEGEDDVAVLLPQEALHITNTLLTAFSNVISAVAAISVIVGGVGIMNIMLVTVTERTREIGIRKAVGATNSQILSQFMIEALIMSLTGGLFGLIAGYALAYAAATFIGFLPGITWHIIATSFGVSLLVGVIFGAWPAIKAARKDPIEALRYFE